MTAPDLKLEYSLPVFSISTDDTDEERELLIAFSATVDGERSDIALLHAPVELFGLPNTDVCENHSMPRGPFQLPDYLVPSIQAAIDSSVAPEKPVWLEFKAPTGLAPIVPWEALLSPFGHPILRLPPQAVMPDVPAHSFDAVVCFSSPSAQELLPERLVEEFIAQIPTDLARYATFHLFADAAVQPLLHAVRDRFGRDFRIFIYDPAKAPQAKRAVDPARAPDVIENPWLVWIRDAMRGQTADVVHFLCHGYVRRGHGAVALAESPLRNVDPEWAAFIFAPELAEFLNALGSWSVAFTSPPGNHSPGGLRLLQHELVQLRPGPVLLHDMEMAHKDDLGNTYRFVYMPQPHKPVVSGGISLYCHPYSAITGTSVVDQTSERVLRDYTLTGKVPNTKQFRWVASSQRILEQAAVKVNTAADAATEEAREGAETALKWVADLIAKHAIAQPDVGKSDEEPK
jgi:hypothetical protein